MPDRNTPVTQHPLHATLRAAGEVVPRYLFRAWGSTSGGDRRLNSVAEIKPHAFRSKGSEVADIFKINPDRLQILIHGHLAGSPVKTVFSSWSHSLPHVLAIARERQDDVHISVIDTHHLKPENFIFHCDGPFFGYFDEEWLMFGVVDGVGLHAAPVKSFEAYIKTFWRPPLGQIATKNPADQYLQDSIAFGRCFGRQVELPMAVFLLTLLDNSALPKHTEKLLAELNVPAAWATDALITDLHNLRATWPKEVLANESLQALVHNLQSSGRLYSLEQGDGEGSSVPHVNSIVDGDEGKQIPSSKSLSGTAASAAIQSNEKAAQQLERSKRVSRKVAQLYIDMVGYDDHNAALM